MIHLRARLDEHLAEIYAELVKMSSKVEKMLTHTCVLLESGIEEQEAVGEERLHEMDTIIKEDKYVDIYEMSIDDHCLQLIATEQPVASDLRKIISVTKITSDLERIGDIARYIAMKLKKAIAKNFQPHIPQVVAMYKTAIGMLSRATEAFVKNDEKNSRIIAAEDDGIDEQHKEIQRAIIREMKSDPDLIKNGQRMFEITRLIELLGDRITSICEWTIFSTEGKHIDLN